MEIKTSKPPEQPVVAQPKETPPPKEQEPSKPSTIEKVKEVLLPKEGEPRKDILSYQVGGATMRLMDISLDALIAAGTSTEKDDQIQILQGGEHDPRKRGFTVQNVELSLMGAVDPYFTGEAHLIYFIDPADGESQFELEEAHRSAFAALVRAVESSLFGGAEVGAEDFDRARSHWKTLHEKGAA